MKSFLKILAVTLALCLLLIYAFLVLLYQFTVVWIVAPILLVAAYSLLAIRAKSSALRRSDGLIILAVPTLLSIGIILRLGGIANLEQLMIAVIYLVIGIIVMALNYASLRWLRSVSEATGN